MLTPYIARKLAVVSATEVSICWPKLSLGSYGRSNSSLVTFLKHRALLHQLGTENSSVIFLCSWSNGNDNKKNYFSLRLNGQNQQPVE